MRAAVVACSAVAVAGLLAAIAAGQAAAPPPVLHEDLPPTAGADDSPLVGAEPQGGRNPAAFGAGADLLPEPAARPPGDDEPVLGRGGFAADRQTSTRPDYATGADGVLRYVSVFNPDVLPFKRMTTLDTVGPDFTLLLGAAGQVDLPVGGVTDPSRDRFWGSVVLELTPGREVPLPSVAPDMRVLSYEATPAVPLTFSRDGADNFYVRSDEPAARGPHRLVFLVDADAGYFAPRLPSRGYTLRQVADRARQAALLPALPPAVLAEAQVTLRALRVEPDDDLARGFDRLVAWFRAFEPGPIDAPTGNLYRDLCDSQAGVCRHRAFAFVITALAAGIPARYVSNEAHAFAEVWFPDQGWQRLDLGGAAMRLEVSNADDKTLHRPRAEDPFAKPRAYRDSYSQLSGDVDGLTGEQLAERAAPPGDGDASGQWDPLVDDDGDGTSDGAAGADLDDAVAPGAAGPPRPADPRKRTPSITITRADGVGYRGEALTVEGRVDDATGPVAGARIDVWLAPAGRRGEDARLVGRGATDADGRFVVDGEVPTDLDLASHELFVTTIDTTTHNAAITE